MRPRTALAALSLLTAACGGAEAGPVPDATIGVFAGGIRWDLPATVCEDGSSDRLRSAATDTATAVESLVATHVSGWPTTTMSPPEAAAGYYVAVNRLGPIALALGQLAGTSGEIENRWSDFEAGYAGASWGPVTDISTRLSGWRHTAEEIVAAVPGACG